MFSCIKASGFGKNLLSRGRTTCRYQSSTSVTSNLGPCGATDAFLDRYMSASSDRVQLRRNWVKVMLLISDTFLWGKKDNTLRGIWDREFCLKSGMRRVRGSYHTCEGHKLMNKASDGFKSCHKSVHNLLKEQINDKKKKNKIRWFCISAWNNFWCLFQFFKSELTFCWHNSLSYVLSWDFSLHYLVKFHFKSVIIPLWGHCV